MCIIVSYKYDTFVNYKSAFAHLSISSCGYKLLWRQESFWHSFHAAYISSGQSEDMFAISNQPEPWIPLEIQPLCGAFLNALFIYF